jgi:hypothetical protein
MGQIIRLAERVRRKATRSAAPKPLGSSAYYCTRCEDDRFRLFTEGEVQCASCGAQMRNLGIGEARRRRPRNGV